MVLQFKPEVVGPKQITITGCHFQSGWGILSE
jgi:hypothetical protein